LGLLIDTSVAIDLLEGSPRILGRQDQFGQDAFLSVVSRIELEAAIYRDGVADDRLRSRLDEFTEQIGELPFTAREVAAYSSIIGVKGFSRRLVVDRMICATAITHGLTLATLNPRDVRGIPGLTVEDWSS
jgi:predicted nucleic acid-binding protein